MSNSLRHNFRAAIMPETHAWLTSAFCQNQPFFTLDLSALSFGSGVLRHFLSALSLVFIGTLLQRQINQQRYSIT